MQDEQGSGSADSGFDPIGVVSRRVGIPVETIRIWERRYAVVEPRRSASGDRLYSEPMMQRLALLKALVDRGCSIGSIAALDDGQLQVKLATLAPASRPQVSAPDRALRLVVVGESIGMRLHRDPGFGPAEVVGAFRAPGDLLVARDPLDCDVLLVELPALHTDSAGLVAQLRARANASGTVVLFGFGNHKALRNLEVQGVVARQLPATLRELRQACLEATTGDPAAPRVAFPAASAAGTARRFSDRQLAFLGGHETSVSCECPRHLVTLVSALNAFEQYSAECASRDDADARLHGWLRETTAQARALMEEALARVAQADGIALEPSQEDREER